MDSDPTCEPHGFTCEAKEGAVAPLLAQGLSLRMIAARTGISLSAVYRAKRRIETASPQPPARQPRSHVVRRQVNGIDHDARRLTVDVFERAVQSAVRRGLLDPAKLDDPWCVISGLFAGQFDNAAIGWLVRHSYVDEHERGRAEAIIAGVNALIERLPR